MTHARMTAVLIMIMACGLAGPATAQEGLPHAGVKAGIGTTSIGNPSVIYTSADPAAGTKGDIGVIGVGFLNFGGESRLSLQLETAFTTRRAVLQGSDGARSVLAVQYLQIPVLAKLRLPARGSLVPYVLAGPSLGVRLGAHVARGDGDLSVSKRTGRTLMGVTVAVGVERSRWLAEVRFDQSLQDVAAVDSNMATTSRAFLLLAGRRF